MADDYGCFGSDTPEQQRAHDAVHDEYEDGCEYWVEHGALVDNEPYNVMDISPHDGAGVAGYCVRLDPSRQIAHRGSDPLCVIVRGPRPPEQRPHASHCAWVVA